MPWKNVYARAGGEGGEKKSNLNILHFVKMCQLEFPRKKCNINSLTLKAVLNTITNANIITE
jgi:hypothetical protein